MLRRTRIAVLATLTFWGADAHAQRTTQMGTIHLGDVPVTAHQQVAWPFGNQVFLKSCRTCPVQASPGVGQPFVATAGRVGFLGPSSVIYVINNAGGSLDGVYVWTAGSSPVRIHASGPNQIYADGLAAAFSISGDIYAYKGGALRRITNDAPVDSNPHVGGGRYVVWHKLTAGVSYEVWRHDLNAPPPTPATVLVDSGSQTLGGAQFPRTDEAGRVVYVKNFWGNAYYRAWDGQVFHDLTPPGFGPSSLSYATHHRQWAWRNYSGGFTNLRLQEGVGPARDIIPNIESSAFLRNGTAASFASGGLQFFDGRKVVSLPWATSGVPAGEFLDRGWVLYTDLLNPPSEFRNLYLYESPLTWNRDVLSAASGGSVNFTLLGGPSNAGRPYLLLAGISGTFPGVTVGALTVPLNWDPVTSLSLTLANGPIFGNTSATLLSDGTSGAVFTVPPGLLAGLAGTTLSFAWFLYAPGLDFASNPARVCVVP